MSDEHAKAFANDYGELSMERVDPDGTAMKWTYKGKLGELTYETTFGKEYDLKAPGGEVYKVGKSYCLCMRCFCTNRLSF